MRSNTCSAEISTPTPRSSRGVCGAKRTGRPSVASAHGNLLKAKWNLPRWPKACDGKSYPLRVLRFHDLMSTPGFHCVLMIAHRLEKVELHFRPDLNFHISAASSSPLCTHCFARSCVSVASDICAPPCVIVCAGPCQRLL